MSLLPGNKAPSFGGIAYKNGRYHDIGLESFEGKWLVLFFLPTDFDFVSSSTLLELNRALGELNSIDCK